MVRAPQLLGKAELGSKRDDSLDVSSPSVELEEAAPAIGQSRMVVGLTLVMSVLGAGMFSIPYAFKEAGSVTGSLLLLLTAAAASYTGETLLWLHVKTGAVSFDELAAMAFGPTAALVVPTVNLLAIFGGCVSYIAIIKSVVPQFLYKIHGWQGPMGSADDNGIFWTGILAVCIILPLCLLENLSSLRFSSKIGLCFSMYLVCLIVYQAADVISHDCAGNGDSGSGCSDRDWYGSDLLWPKDVGGIAVGSSIFNFAYVLHFNVIPLYHELADPTPARMVSVIRGVVCITTAVYMVVGHCGLALYGSSTDSNILAMFPTDAPYTIARVAICLVLVFAFPLIFYPLRVTLHNLLTLIFDLDPTYPTSRRLLESACFLSVIVLTAVTIPNLGLVFSITGGTSIVCIVYFFPLSFRLKLAQSSAEQLTDTKVQGYASVATEDSTVIASHGEGSEEDASGTTVTVEPLSLIERSSCIALLIVVGILGP